MQDSGPLTVSRPGTSVRTSLFVSYLLTLLLPILLMLLKRFQDAGVIHLWR